MIRDAAGNLYGTTTSGGVAGNTGVVYKLDRTGKYSVLYEFTGGNDGFTPSAALIFDPSGNLYGTTSEGGTGGHGVVFELDPSGNYTVLYSFTGGTDGGGPAASLLRDEAGNLYGTTASGGDLGASVCNGFGCGVVFKLDTAGNETVLYAFTGGADGQSPNSAVIRDSAGNLYGTTGEGGDRSAGGACPGYGCGVVFKLDPAGHLTPLHRFTGGNDGVDPTGVIRDAAGRLFGSTYAGGAAGFGVLYSLDTAGRQKVLYNFTGGLDGGSPVSTVIADPGGNLYGTTTAGGTGNAGIV